MLVAAIGIGSNSLRMLIADIKGEQLHRMMRDREGLRVYAELDRKRNITPVMMDKASRKVARFVQKAKNKGAEKIHLFATSAVRDAKNQAEFCMRLAEATGIRPEICSGELEAKLSFLGVAGTDHSGMIDVGGGSTELVIGQGKRIDFSASLQMGAVRLYREMPISSAEDAKRVVAYARNVLLSVVAGVLSQGTVEWVGVGGTFTALATLVQDISWASKRFIHGYSLTTENVQKAMNGLAGMDEEHRMRLRSIQPQRADIIVHGIAILLACMQELAIERVMVSESSNLEGYLKHLYL